MSRRIRTKHKYHIKKTKKNKKQNKKTKKKKIKSKKKIYKEYGPGLKYLIFDGNKNVFKYVGKDDKR